VVISRVAAEALLVGDHTLRPTPLMALQELEDGNLRGYSLNYPRLKSDGFVFRNDFLDLDIDVR
jgi:hypothetical protein